MGVLVQNNKGLQFPGGYLLSESLKTIKSGMVAQSFESQDIQGYRISPCLKKKTPINI